MAEVILEQYQRVEFFTVWMELKFEVFTAFFAGYKRCVHTSDHIATTLAFVFFLKLF